MSYEQWTLSVIGSWSVLWFGLLAKKYRLDPSRLGLTALFILQGAIAAHLAIVSFEPMMSLGWLDWVGDPEADPTQTLAGSILGIGLVEETIKWGTFVLVWGLVPRMRRSLDVLAASAATGIGFAAAETWATVGGDSRSEVLVRACTSPFIHLVFAAVWAWGWTHLIRGGLRGVLFAVLGLIGATVLHGLYDFMALQEAMVFGTGPFLVLSWLLVSIWVEREVHRRDVLPTA